MTPKQFKVIKHQRDARRWFSVAEWCRDMYVKFGDIGYLHEYHHSMAIAKHHYRASRVLMDAEPYGSLGFATATFEVEVRFDAIRD